MRVFTPFFRIALGCGCLAVGLLGGLLGGPIGGIAVMPLMLIAGLCLAEPIGSFIAGRINGMVYPKIFLKVAPQRIAAAEALAAKRNYEEAQTAFVGILNEEPDNLPAAMSYVKMLLAWKKAGGRAEACEILAGWLSRQRRAVAGGIDAAMLLADLLQEEDMEARLEDILSVELSKGYCSADKKLLQRRLSSIQSNRSKG